MTPEQIAKLKEDFEAWSGGFPPESTHQVEVYLEHAIPLSLYDHKNEAREILNTWINDD